jgi:hypothetical protein
MHITLLVFMLCCYSQALCAALAEPLLLLDPREPITAVKAFDCYKQYEAELRGKSQEELDSCIKNILRHKSADEIIHSYRPKLVALLFAGAQFSADNSCVVRFVSSTVAKNDLSLVQYALERNALYLNYRERYVSLPIIRRCKHIEMAKLLIRNGADITNRGLMRESILHHICDKMFRNSETINFIQLYCGIHPQLIHETDALGQTPLALVMDDFGLKELEPVTSCKALIRDIPLVYTLLNLGARTDIYAVKHAYYGKNPYEIVTMQAEQTEDEQLKEKLFELAEYILHPTDTRSSLFERLMVQLHDKPADHAATDTIPLPEY